MLSSVLRSERAVQVNIEIMRAFVRLREMIATHKDLARKLEALEKRYDAQFKVVFDAIRELMAPPTRKKRKIGFLVKERAARYGRGSRGHFGVSGILETWKYHGHGFMDKTKPMVTHIARIESQTPTKPPLWLGVTSVNHVEPLVERPGKEKDPRN